MEHFVDSTEGNKAADIIPCRWHLTPLQACLPSRKPVRLQLSPKPLPVIAVFLKSTSNLLAHRAWQGATQT